LGSRLSKLNMSEVMNILSDKRIQGFWKYFVWLYTLSLIQDKYFKTGKILYVYVWNFVWLYAKLAIEFEKHWVVLISVFSCGLRFLGIIKCRSKLRQFVYAFRTSYMDCVLDSGRRLLIPARLLSCFLNVNVLERCVGLLVTCFSEQRLISHLLEGRRWIAWPAAMRSIFGYRCWSLGGPVRNASCTHMSNSVMRKERLSISDQFCVF
jgi:hypothetical protein